MSREQLEEEFLNKAKRNKSFKQAVGGRRSSIKEELARNCEVGKSIRPFLAPGQGRNPWLYGGEPSAGIIGGQGGHKPHLSRSIILPIDGDVGMTE